MSSQLQLIWEQGPWRSPRFLFIWLLAAVAVGVLMGIPTDLLPNPLYTRMTAITPEQYFFWVATSVLTGALVATYFLPGLGHQARGSGLGSGLLGYLAIGCPICNKVIVAVIGVSGALSYFAPIQPVLGGLALVLAAVGLTIRLRAMALGCPLPPRRTAAN